MSKTYWAKFNQYHPKMCSSELQIKEKKYAVYPVI